MYNYECLVCSKEFTAFNIIRNRKDTTCPKCGKHSSEGYITLKVAAPRISHFKQGWYEHIGPKPVFIATPQQLRDECEKTGSKSVALENSVFKTRKYHDKAEEDGRAATGDDNPKAVS